MTGAVITYSTKNLVKIDVRIGIYDPDTNEHKSLDLTTEQARSIWEKLNDVFGENIEREYPIFFQQPPQPSE